MTAKKKLRDELLEQNGTGTQKMGDFRDRVLATDRARVARMNGLVVCAWTVVVASLVAAVITRVWFPDIIEFKPQLVPLFITVFQALFLLATVFTISLYIRSRTLTMHQIQSTLAAIEEHLRKMAQKD